MNQIISNTARVYDFVRQYVPVSIVAGSQALGLEKDGELVAGVIYEGFNGHNVWMHVAGAPGKRWMTKLYLQTCFHYPFVTLGCSRISGYVEARNEVALAFDEHLGFKREAVLKGAASDGGDVVLLVMRREDCKYV